MPLDLTFGALPAWQDRENSEREARRYRENLGLIDQYGQMAGANRGQGRDAALGALQGGFGSARNELVAAGNAALGPMGGGGAQMGGPGGAFDLSGSSAGSGSLWGGGGGGASGLGGSLGAGYAEAGGQLERGRGDMLGAYGQGQGALWSGAAAAQGRLDPYINQDMAARGAYQDRLMGGLAGGDDPYWNRLSARRTSGIEASLAKQGMLGSSAGASALADSGAQLQQAREQQFFNRAQGLFNAGAAGQAAGLAQQAGADSAGLFGRQGEGLAGMGREGARLFQDRGRDVSAAQLAYGRDMASNYAQEGAANAGIWQGWGAGSAGDKLGLAGMATGQPYATPQGNRFTDPGDVLVGLGARAVGAYAEGQFNPQPRRGG